MSFSFFFGRDLSLEIKVAGRRKKLNHEVFNLHSSRQKKSFETGFPILWLVALACTGASRVKLRHNWATKGIIVLLNRPNFLKKTLPLIEFTI